MSLIGRGPITCGQRKLGPFTVRWHYYGGPHTMGASVELLGWLASANSAGDRGRININLQLWTPKAV